MISHSKGTRSFRGRNVRARGLHSSGSACSGFSLPELLVSMAVLMVVAGGVISMISYNENTFGRTEQQSDMYENVRAVAELMAQEIGQAGLADLPAGATLSAAVTKSATAQTVAVSSTTSMYAGEILLVDTATNEESVTIVSLTSSSINGIFANNHASGAVVHAIGVSPNGIVSPSSSATTPGGVSCVTVPSGVTYTSPATTPSTCNVLNIWGDLNSDGTLVYVRYTCNTTTTPGTLTRSVTTITPGVNTVSTAQTLLSTVIPNPPSTAPTPCFQYDLSTQSLTVNGVVTGTYYMIANIGLTISVRTLKPDPVTNQYLTMTKSFLDLSPRNILAGYEQANWGDSTRLQGQPPNVTLY
ncbi:MAG TPA: prepilin-type N-terminal cleavage/methylation domain-containing protein [Candidatus Saccharimonadales bacterium]|jgi:prepilin-type N-terminal cleavage/methylation domain-containing protein|nr:prepilin-type N-terminal cleavage/methylation domain-containing protein [Candidatus Saccharimonadales bacterium]